MRGQTLALCSLLMSGSLPAEVPPEKIAFFESRIRPVLVEKCYECHSQRNGRMKGGLALDTAEALREGGENGPAVVAGDPNKSLIIQAIRYTDSDTAMPPENKGGKLPDAVIKDFEQWVRDGAHDLRTSATRQRVATTAKGEARRWWSYQPVNAPAVPQVRDTTWPHTDIDCFILAGLETKKLKPVADAEKLHLLRRAYFALTGLPPPPEKIEAFAVTNDADAFEQVVDELLGTRQYGERWGRHWLDVARYAETSGRDVNGIYPEAWRYRDYVITAFQEDKPFDRFILEQLAGDLLPDTSDAERARLLTATGFLAIGPKSLNEQNPRQLALDVADEQIDATSRAFLGMTIACARCHDHKTDPVTQEDYTALAGIFLSTDTRYGAPGGAQARNGTALIEVPDELGLPVVERTMDPGQLADLAAEHASLMDLFFETLNANGGGPPRPGMLTQDGKPLDEIMIRVRGLEVDIRAFRTDGTLKPRIMGALDKLSSEDIRNGAQLPRNGPPTGFDLICDSPFFLRGQLEKEGDLIARGLPLFLNSGKSMAIPPNTSGRLELARWIASPSNPLTARVFVNRAWHWLFGRGLVTSVDDIGKTGALPVNSALLDHLASQFVRGGWSVKKLVREIILSRVWQLSRTDGGDPLAATIDPNNDLLRRANSRSLDAESMRDAIMAASGALNLAPQRGSLLAMTGHGSISGPRFSVLAADVITNADGDFRSIYLPAARDVPQAVLAIFNGADSAGVFGARETTIVPAQALFLMNSEFVTRHSALLAKRVLAAGSGFESRFRSACLLVLGRPPLAEESAAARKFVTTQTGTHEAESWTSLCRSLFCSAEFRFL